MSSHSPSPIAGERRTPRVVRLLEFLSQDPDNLALRADLFDAALESGDFLVAEQQLSFVRKIKYSPEWQMREANLAIANLQLDRAQVLLRTLETECGPHPSIAQNLGFISALRGQHEACLAMISPWADVAPNDPLPPSMQALWLRTLHHLGQVDSGVNWARQRLAYGQLEREALGVASLLALDANQGDLAQKWADHALSISKQPPVVEAQIARASLMLGDNDAKATLVAVADILINHPQEGRTWSIKGFAHLLDLDLDNARSSLEHATVLMPAHIGTWHGLAWTCLLSKDYIAAQQAFEEALQLNRNFAESYGGLAVLAAVQNQHDAAQEHLRRAFGLDSESFSARYAQALLNGDIQDMPALREFARKMMVGIKIRR